MSLMTNLVVPAIGDTIAAGLCASILSRVLLPALGGPTIATRIPEVWVTNHGREEHQSKEST